MGDREDSRVVVVRRGNCNTSNVDKGRSSSKSLRREVQHGAKLQEDRVQLEAAAAERQPRCFCLGTSSKKLTNQRLSLRAGVTTDMEAAIRQSQAEQHRA